MRANSRRIRMITRRPCAERFVIRARVRTSDSISASERGFSARNCAGMVRMRATVSERKGTEPTINVGRRRAIFSMESLRQQSPIAGKPRTEQTSAHHRVTATSWRLAPRAQRIEVQDGASETMRNPVERFEMWPAAIVQQNSKDVKI